MSIIGSYLLKSVRVTAASMELIYSRINSGVSERIYRIQRIP